MNSRCHNLNVITTTLSFEQNFEANPFFISRNISKIDMEEYNCKKRKENPRFQKGESRKELGESRTTKMNDIFLHF